MANMVASWATYRRNAPRLKLRVRRRPHNIREAYLAEDKSRWCTSFHVHAINRSAADVQVEKVQMIGWMPSFWPVGVAMRYAFRRLLEMPVIAQFFDFTFLEGEDQKVIPAHGGVRWVLADLISRGPYPQRWYTALMAFQLRVTLTNGREIRSRPMPLRRVVAEHREVYKAGLAFVERSKGDVTLDDALKELEEERKGTA
ncbi:hypothetical protein [Streptomyces sp. NBC_01237]|uniref:hypothetical protein n=1 Tax=Streptomyces sp. NBC_01237 TaxID=2903790 RepID=UPI002DDBB0CD|nr:hypothetical protein [Streptomyces sp. NBC_01237]WRZ76443.1 hypothetical protein OG251_35155 [Streptomyces sp. NBC_01237]